MKVHRMLASFLGHHGLSLVPTPGPLASQLSSTLGQDFYDTAVKISAQGCNYLKT